MKKKKISFLLAIIMMITLSFGAMDMDAMGINHWQRGTYFSWGQKVAYSETKIHNSSQYSRHKATAELYGQRVNGGTKGRDTWSRAHVSSWNHGATAYAWYSWW